MVMSLSSRASELLVHPAPHIAATGEERMAQAAIDAVNDALDRGETHYTDRPGILPLRQKVSDLLNARYNLATKPSDLTITCGLTEARFVCVQQLIGPEGKVFALAKPDEVSGAALVRGATMSGSAEDADLVFVPASARSERIRAGLSVIKPDCSVVFEVDSSSESFHPASLEGLAERVVTIGELGIDRGLATARLGYLAAPSRTAPGLRDFKQALTICSTNLSQWAALNAVEAL
jgi:aspartate/methionine/tyrosine aminotransferase